MDSDRFFLCFGLPKSGTTFLQRMLDMHPEVSCPSEQDFVMLNDGLIKLFNDYNSSLVVGDRRTGGQGARLVSTEPLMQIFRNTVLTLSRGLAGNARVHGLNDNMVYFNVKLHDELFGRPKMICIMRNPVDRAISLWYAAHRLAAEEPETARENMEKLRNPEGSLDGYVKEVAKLFAQRVEPYISYATGRPNFLTLRARPGSC